MKASLVYWHKARLRGRYVLEIEIYKICPSAKYQSGIKYGLIFMDLRSKKRVLMDNHHPYYYIDEEKLMKDLKALVLEHMEVKI